MLIIPAIDLKDHQVVRLSQGRMEDAKIYSADPVQMAKQWVDCGIKRLHLVDLNGAFEGRAFHFDEVSSILKKFPEIEIEIGGGIRNHQTLEKYFEAGVKFCILGTAAVKNPEFLSEACKKYPGRIILGVDAREGLVATEGWDKISRGAAVDLVQSFEHEALSAVIYTDIAKDGMLCGMNHQSVREMAKHSPFPVIASGGLTELEDIKKLKKIGNVCGVIAGKALYEGKMDLKEALQAAAS